MEWAIHLVGTRTRDPFCEGDVSMYSETRPLINSLAHGQLFLHQQARKP